MSLIEVWRERKAERRGGPATPPRLWKLVITLILVIFLIYQLSQLV